MFCPDCKREMANEETVTIERWSDYPAGSLLVLETICKSCLSGANDEGRVWQ